MRLQLFRVGLALLALMAVSACDDYYSYILARRASSPGVVPPCAIGKPRAGPSRV